MFGQEITKSRPDSVSNAFAEKGKSRLFVSEITFPVVTNISLQPGAELLGKIVCHRHQSKKLVAIAVLGFFLKGFLD